MSSITAPERIRRRVREVAQELRESGYEVIVEPREAEVPEFLKGLEPDLIARGERDSVVVEVKSRADLKGSSRLSELTARVNAQPGWRLDLVVSNPRDPKRLEGSEPWDVADIARRMNESHVLWETGHQNAAFVLLWAATEALLRHLALRENVSVPELEPPRRLINELVARGALSRADYIPLVEASDARNQVVHGIGISEVRASILEQLDGVSERLLAEVQRAA